MFQNCVCKSLKRDTHPLNLARLFRVNHYQHSPLSSSSQKPSSQHKAALQNVNWNAFRSHQGACLRYFSSKPHHRTNQEEKSGEGKKIIPGDSFEHIISENGIYIDKTKFICELIDRKYKYYFLSRPRRFGKSLLVSTIHNFFESTKEGIFDGCYVNNVNYKREKHPVLSFNFGSEANSSPENLERKILGKIQKHFYQHKIEVTWSNNFISNRFTELVEKLAEREGKVVVLIDEYDKPITSRFEANKLSEIEKIQGVLSEFYSQLKELNSQLELVFITGLTKFSQVSLFSDLNNLVDISFRSDFSSIVGFTEKEIKNNYWHYIKGIQESRNMTEEEVLEEIRYWYNGYRFSFPDKGEEIYNPWSVQFYLIEKQVKNYWFTSGSPRLLIDWISKSETSASRPFQITEEDLLATKVEQTKLESVMLQSGYLTIREAVPTYGSTILYLKYPNTEVYASFNNALIKYFQESKPETSLTKCKDALKNLDFQTFFVILNKVIGKFTYNSFADYNFEKEIQNIVSAYLFSSSIENKTEVPYINCRKDMEISSTHLCSIELKVGQSAGKALEQLHDRDVVRFDVGEGKKIVLIGANINRSQKKFDHWKAEVRDEWGKILNNYESSIDLTNSP